MSCDGAVCREEDLPEIRSAVRLPRAGTLRIRGDRASRRPSERAGDPGLGDPGLCRVRLRRQGEHEGTPGGQDVPSPGQTEEATSPQRGREDAALARIPGLTTVA